MSYIGNQPTTAAFVTDQFSGTGSQTAFTMSVAPATPASVLVSVSGVLQDPSTYSVSGTTLTFSAAPPSGTGNISCRYLGIPASGVTTTAYRTVTEFTATAGQTTFTPPSYTAGYINVYRNGVRLNSADYTATNGTTVVLTNAATSGDLIATESFYVSSVVGAIPATAGAVNSTYIANGAVGTTQLASSPTITSPTITNNLTFGTSNAGIIFNNSSALTNSTLNDYETGTFTLTITPNSGSLTSYTSYGYYVKIGRTVTITMAFAISNSGSASGVANFSGLPFTSLNPTPLSSGGNRAGTFSMREDAGTGNWYFGFVSPNSTSGVISNSTNGAIAWNNGYAYVTSFVYEAQF